MNFLPTEGIGESRSAHVHGYHTRIRKSLQKHLVSDTWYHRRVDSGMCLDSRLKAALLSHTNPENMKTSIQINYI
jgi:hypothetical protein